VEYSVLVYKVIAFEASQTLAGVLAAKVKVSDKFQFLHYQCHL
jgi:hypothetical protein